MKSPVLAIVILLIIAFSTSFSGVVEEVKNAIQNHRINNYKIQEYERIRVRPPAEQIAADESTIITEDNLEKSFEPSSGISNEQRGEILDLLSETGLEENSSEID